MRRLFIYAIFSVVWAGCSDEDLSFLSIEDALPIMESCNDSRIDDAAVVAEGLTGTWQLVAYGCGLCIPHDAPAVRVSFGEGTGLLIFTEDPYSGSSGLQELSFTWQIKEVVGGNGLQLVTDPPHYTLSSIGTFCKRHMYFDHRPFDGLMMLYVKL